MQIDVREPKIYRAAVTEPNIHFVVSISTDECLMEGKKK
jgi:hypothetical protein